MRFLWDCAVFFTFSFLTLCVAASASSAVFAASSAAAFAACEHGNKHFGHAVLGDAVFLGMQHNLCFVPGSGTFINLLRGQRFALALALADDTEVIHLLRHAAGHPTRKLPLHFG